MAGLNQKKFLVAITVDLDAGGGIESRIETGVNHQKPNDRRSFGFWWAKGESNSVKVTALQ